MSQVLVMGVSAPKQSQEKPTQHSGTDLTMRTRRWAGRLAREFKLPPDVVNDLALKHACQTAEGKRRLGENAKRRVRSEAQVESLERHALVGMDQKCLRFTFGV